jgi:proline iminopeptidase
VAGEAGVRLFYRVDGSRPDTLVVLQGGPGLNLEGLRPDLRPLARHHTLLYFDQRGSGRSEMPDTLRLTADLMVEDVEALRRTFRLEPAHPLGALLGRQPGGALRRPVPDRVRRMVLVGPVPPRPHPYFEQYAAGQTARLSSAETARQAQLDSIQKVAPDPYSACRGSNRIFLRGVAGTPGAADRIKGDLCAGTPTNLRLTGVLNRRVWTSLFGSSDDCDWRPIAARIEAPTLVVHGDRDPLPLAGSVEWARALANARLVVIPGAGHYPHAKLPERFFPEVEAFLGRGNEGN